jgi:hypothetical protein
VLIHGCAIAATVLFGALAFFQAGLAAGLPWGKAAWGGSQAQLSPRLRVASGFSILLCAAMALTVLRRSGYNSWAPIPDSWLPVATWIITGYLAFGIALNAISRSRIERLLMVPTTVALTTLCAIVASADQ